MRAGSMAARADSITSPAPLAAFAVAARVLVAACVPLALAFAGTNAPLGSRTLAYGRHILDGRGLGIELGREVFGGVGNAAGAFGWANALVFALAHAALGDAGIFALTALAAGGAIAFVAAATRARSSTLVASLVAALTFVTSLGELRVGGAALAWCACAAFLFCAAHARAAADESQARRWILGATFAAICWCNCSAYGIAAPLIGAAYAIGATLSASATTPIARRSWLVTLGAALATLVTPALFSYPALAFGMLAFDRDAIAPLIVHPIEIDAFGYRNGFVAFAILLTALGVPRARRGIDAWPVVAAFLLALENGALLALFAFVAAPTLAEALEELVSGLRSSREGASRPSLRVALAVWGSGAIVAVLALVFARDRALSPQMSIVPDAPLYAQTLQHDARLHRIVCERVERCADIVALGDPKLRVLMDDRVTAYPASVRKLQTDFAGLKGAWLDPLVAGRTDALVVENGAHIDVVLSLGTAWHRLASDQHVAVYERAGAR